MHYPFSAVLGMEDLRLALALNAVSPAIGGVLARGEKGTAKSTMVRGLTAVLPAVSVVAGCRFACDPAAPDPLCPDGPHLVVEAVSRPAALRELPVGASEDRLVGALDLERALTEGVKRFEPGLLAAAHRGVLYVDEVNLLHDHLVDLLLDAAALGVSYVERDGMSIQHAARFLLVGTMNPEEGELRPQLLDRFGLSVDVAAPQDIDSRTEVVRRRLAFDADPVAFGARFAAEERAFAGRIVAAQAALPSVELPDAALRQIASICAAFGVEGLRADIVTSRAARAHAAWCGREEVGPEDIRAAARLALPHRTRRNPFDAPGIDQQQLDDAIDKASADNPPDSRPDPDDRPPGGQPSPETDAAPDDSADFGAAGGARPDEVAAPSGSYRPRRLEVSGLGEGTEGRRSRAVADHGRTVGAQVPDGRIRRLHLIETVVAAAPYQRERGRRGNAMLLRREDLREARREGREGNLVLFAVDASGSMAARSRMAAVKGAVLSLLLDAYQRRDKVGLISFRGDDASLLLPPTSSVEVAARRLEVLPTGGRTPLAAGLACAEKTLRAERIRDPRRRPLLVVVTDGRHTRGPAPTAIATRLARQGVASVVVDCEAGRVRLGLAADLAASLGADRIVLEDLAADSLAASVQAVRGAA